MKVISNEKYQQLKKQEIDNNHFSWNDYCLSCALAITDEIRKLKCQDVTVAFGRGEIGDIGVLIANILCEWGYSVKAVAPQKDSFFALNRNIYETANLREAKNIIGKSSIIIDCLFDASLTEKIEHPYKNIIQWINRSDAHIISVDIPSGISSETGNILGVAVEADETMCFEYPKMGNIVSEGKLRSGEMKMLRSIFSVDALDRLPKQAIMYNDSEIKKLVNDTYPTSYTKKPNRILFFNGKEEPFKSESTKILTLPGNNSVTVYTETGDNLKRILKGNELSNIDLGVLFSGHSFEDAQTIIRYFVRYSFPLIINGEYLPCILNCEIETENKTIIVVIDEKQYESVFNKSNRAILDNLKTLAKTHPNLIVLYRSNQTVIADANNVIINCNGKKINESIWCSDILCGIIAEKLDQENALNSVIVTEYIFSLANMLWSTKREYCMNFAKNMSEFIKSVFDTFSR